MLLLLLCWPGQGRHAGQKVVDGPMRGERATICNKNLPPPPPPKKKVNRSPSFYQTTAADGEQPTQKGEKVKGAGLGVLTGHQWWSPGAAQTLWHELPQRYPSCPWFLRNLNVETIYTADFPLDRYALYQQFLQQITLILELISNVYK